MSDSININWRAAGAVVLPNVGGIAGGVITRKYINPWYESLKKPDWRPPNWAFGPVWTGLYSSMGYASFIVFRDGGGFNGPAKLPLIAYGAHLALNWSWTPIFFGAKKLRLAFYEILALDAAAIGTSYLFYQINPIAGYLMAPYILWLGLASTLTYVIQRDNPQPKIKELADKE